MQAVVVPIQEIGTNAHSKVRHVSCRCSDAQISSPLGKILVLLRVSADHLVGKITKAEVQSKVIRTDWGRPCSSALGVSLHLDMSRESGRVDRRVIEDVVEVCAEFVLLQRQRKTEARKFKG